MISVCMIVYQHELYVEQAINGVLDQIVDYEFDLIISNDNSKDGSHEVITNIISTHPKGKLIKYFNQWFIFISLQRI